MIWGIALILLAVVFFELFVERGELIQIKTRYRYNKKTYLLTRPELDCFKALELAAGDKYNIFPQVHLSSIFDHRVKGQNWRAAFNHINQKSVDFLLCEKNYLTPVLAIELDDKSHEMPNRVTRDENVELIFNDAKMPLLRIDHQSINPEILREKIAVLLSK